MEPHPYGVQPWGNYYLNFVADDESDAKRIKRLKISAGDDDGGEMGDIRNKSLGEYFSKLTDDLVVQILLLLEAEDLARLTRVSKLFYAFTHYDEIWKILTIQRFQGNVHFRGSWRQTYIVTLQQKDYVEHVPLRVENFYSDVLFRPWLCSQKRMELQWLKTENIERRSNLSLEEFIEQYERPNKPVILTDVVTKWPAFGKWNEEYLLERYGHIIFRAEAVEMPLKEYFRYANLTKDEAPLYLFDKLFCERAFGMADDYTVPSYFEEDLFSLLGDKRPDYRWLIIGPSRAGSTFHKDPNSTSAWNGVITGSKKWIMFPPDQLPPGVYPSTDGGEVTTPISLMEWFMGFYNEIRKLPPNKRPIEGICRAGEMMFVPNGWWHMVINLEPSIAITQNYVSHRNLLNVLDFLRNQPYNVSGYCGENLYQDFVTKFESKYPGKIRQMELEVEEQKKAKLTTWQKLTSSQSNNGVNHNDKTDFRFGFSGSDDEEENELGEKTS